MKSIRRKQILYKKWLNKKTDVLLSKYKLFKNKLTTVLRSAEKSYYNLRFSEVKNDMKRTWGLIKSIINSKTSSNNSSRIDELLINGKIISDKKLMANKFNEYFTNIGSTLARKIPNAPGSYKDFLHTINSSKSFFARPTNPLEIINIVHNFKAKKSAGFDEISPSVLKTTISYVAEPLANIFNLSLHSGVFPDLLKIAKVVPVFKTEDRKLMVNYRPISVLPVFSKILEKIMYKRLITYLENNNILSDKQYGFRERHSTYMALVELVDKVTEELDNKKFSVGIFVDLSKAFDTINHNILLDKLNSYGIRGTSNSWFCSYLSNRLQYVQLSNVKSDRLQINCGVPQGSILGPLLFILYINDISYVSNVLNLIMFADDTNLFLSDSSLERLCGNANAELAKIYTWFKLNKLSLNIKKTNFILFGTQNTSNNKISIKLDNIQIDQVTRTKFLGVILSQTLSWKDHIHLIKQKVSKSTGIIRKIRYNLPPSVLVSLYHTLVHPYFEYCNIVWGINRSTTFNDLFICQKRHYVSYLTLNIMRILNHYSNSFQFYHLINSTTFRLHVLSIAVSIMFYRLNFVLCSKLILLFIHTILDIVPSFDMNIID